MVELTGIAKEISEHIDNVAKDNNDKDMPLKIIHACICSVYNNYKVHTETYLKEMSYNYLLLWKKYYYKLIEQELHENKFPQMLDPWQIGLNQILAEIENRKKNGTKTISEGN